MHEYYRVTKCICAVYRLAHAKVGKEKKEKKSRKMVIVAITWVNKLQYYQHVYHCLCLLFEYTVNDKSFEGKKFCGLLG